MAKNYMKATVTKLPDSEIEIDVEASSEMLLSFREKALAHLKEHASLPGFRKGKVPEKMLIEKAGEMGVLEEAAELLVKEAYPEIVADLKLDIIGMPRVSVTKLAPNNPLTYKIHTALFPTFDLPDYKKIAKEIMAKQEPITVTDKDTEAVISEVRKMRAVKKEDGTEELPELTDELVKSIGPFQSVDDFKKQLIDNLTKEKEFRAKEKRRLEIIGKIIEKSDIPVPSILIESELDRMFAQFADDTKRMGTTMSDYLTKAKKNEEQLRTEWKPDAKARVRFELILEKIAGTEKIEAPKDEVDKESDHIIEHHEGAIPERVRAYVEHQLRNEAVFTFLEK